MGHLGVYFIFHVPIRVLVLLTPLILLKVSKMNDWLPHVYRVGGSRVAFVDTSFLSESFQLLSDAELFALGRKLGLRKKDENPIYAELDTRLVENWPIVLRDLEILGWGEVRTFWKRDKDRILLHANPFILGFFDGIFDTPFKPYFTKINIIILTPTYRTE